MRLCEYCLKNEVKKRAKRFCSHHCQVLWLTKKQSIDRLGLTKNTSPRVAKMSISKLGHSPRWKDPISRAKKIGDALRGRSGVKASFETRMKMIGRPNLNPNGYGKSFYREDLNTYFRSTWEANFARTLNYSNIKWEYEKHRIYLSNCSYLPDFYLPDLALYIEVKGARFGNKDKKLEMLYKEKPNFPIKVIDGEVYNILKKKYYTLISNWEK